MRISGLVREPLDLHNAAGDIIRADLRFKPSEGERPVVVICHSFMAFKDWGFFPYVGEKIAEAGFATVTFNFSHNGVIGDGEKISDFKAFERNTFSQELHDLTAVLDSISGGGVGKGRIVRDRIVLLGHSRGGGISIMRAATDCRVRGLISWSAIASFDRWTLHQKIQWRRLGYLPLARDIVASPLRIGLGLLDDLEEHKSELDVLEAATRIRVPWLIVHGKADLTVSRREAEQLASASGSTTTELALFDGVGHLYNARTMDVDQYQTLDQILQRTIHWLYDHF